MPSYNRDSRSGGRDRFQRRDFGGRRSFGDSERKQMFKTVCDNCGKTCEVPFKPTGDKPVYCNDCYREMGGNERNDSPRRFNDRHEHRSDSNNSATNQMLSKMLDRLDSVNAKLEKLLKNMDGKTPKAQVMAEESADVEKSEKKVKSKKKAKAE